MEQTKSRAAGGRPDRMTMLAKMASVAELENQREGGDCYAGERGFVSRAQPERLIERRMR